MTALLSGDHISRPFLIAGPVILFCGLMFMLLSIEVIVRLNRNAKRVQDPEIDQVTNLHLIKHWMDPGIETTL